MHYKPKYFAKTTSYAAILFKRGGVIRGLTRSIYTIWRYEYLSRVKYNDSIIGSHGKRMAFSFLSRFSRLWIFLSWSFT
jgi:hypothetical protein